MSKARVAPVALDHQKVGAAAGVQHRVYSPWRLPSGVQVDAGSAWVAIGQGICLQGIGLQVLMQHK